ncbi:hypothetical protein H2201_005916 [Coniosporium apollinis]|uniref:Alpha-galactosidase n=2 Tax=Coniosporium TaxID=2810619 RepID=A0ABQ9NQ61_9PEZI|nr:hypothetical protein H2199_006866 [Cladosporium sp. JES 115]KAJ9662835.1 hypothetical protein H2201_005916 [Coniosporium apollinis]
MNILNKMSSYPDRGMSGAWNDLDMLEVGNGGMTDIEYTTHFTMWAAVKSPLIMDNNILNMDARALIILLNPAVLAISQDPLGSSAVRRWRYCLSSYDVSGNATAAQGDGPAAEIQMWSGSLSEGDYFVALLNLGPEARTMSATLADIFVDEGGSRSEEAQSSWDVYDLWTNRMPNRVANAIIVA